MSEPSLLPPNATALELAVERTFTSPPVPNAAIWNPDTCPAELLPWLASALSVDFWKGDWPEETKREVIRQSVRIHRKKGTIGSIRRALAAMGFPQARIFEEYGTAYDATVSYDGAIRYEGQDHWAEYRVYIDRPITAAQGEEVRAILDNIAPVRCHLVGLFFLEAANSYNGATDYDGSYTYGVA